MKILISVIVAYAILINIATGLGVPEHTRRLQGDLSLVDRTDNVNNSYDVNWSGVVVTHAPERSNITNVLAQVIVSPLSGPGFVSAWIGIDGTGGECASALWHTGISCSWTNGNTSCSAWYEWLPQAEEVFPQNLAVNVGDAISMYLQAYNTTAGLAKITNLTTNQTVAIVMVASDLTPICGSTAEWIVEDSASNGGFTPFAEFGNVTFTQAVAGTNQGELMGIDGASIWDIRNESNLILTHTHTIGNGTVVVEHA